ncbi:MAG: PAS domain S-box protein, partial [Candidatus Gracilibacteria bacterium]
MTVATVHVGKDKKVLLSDFVSLKTLQRIQDTLAQALSVSLVIVDAFSKKPITKRSNMSVFCSHMRNSESFISECRKHEAHCGNICLNATKSSVFECHAGLFGFTVPIMLSGRIVAYFKGGQVRLSNPDIVKCKTLADIHGVDFDSYLEMFLAIPLFSKEKLDASMDLLSVIANTISNLAVSGQIAKSKATEILYLNELLEKEVLRKTEELRKSEERYRGIFDNALDIIYTIDGSGVFIDMNDVIESLGYLKADIIGKHFSEFIYNDDLHTVVSSFQDLKSRKRTTTRGLKFRILSKSLKPVYFELNSHAVYNIDGDLEKIDGFLHNVDDTVKMNMQLRSVKEKYKELFDSMRDGVYMVDENGVVTAFNKAALNILGCDGLFDIIGKNIVEFYRDPLDRKAFVKKVMENGFVDDYVLNIKKMDGTPIYISVTASGLKDENGRFKGIEGVFRDVTNRVELEKEVVFMKKYLDALISSAGQGIIGVDMDKNIFVWNKEAERIFGYKASEVIGRDVSVIIPRDWRTQRSD